MNNRTRRIFFVILLSQLFLCALFAAYFASGPRRVKAAWLENYPELCARNNLSVIYFPSISLTSYLLKCEIYPETMDYANPLVIVDIWKCTAVLYLPNLNLPGGYLGKFASTTRMPVCP